MTRIKRAFSWYGYSNIASLQVRRRSFSTLASMIAPSTTPWIFSSLCLQQLENTFPVFLTTLFRGWRIRTTALLLTLQLFKRLLWWIGLQLQQQRREKPTFMFWSTFADIPRFKVVVTAEPPAIAEWCVHVSILWPCLLRPEHTSTMHSFCLNHNNCLRVMDICCCLWKLVVYSYVAVIELYCAFAYICM